MFKRLVVMVMLLLSLSSGVLHAADTVEQKSQETPALKENSADTAPQLHTVQGRLKEGIRKGTTENLNQWMIKKGNEIYASAKASSVLYIAVVAAAFLLCMLLGIFFKKMITTGFIILCVGILAFFVLQFLPDIMDLISGQVVEQN